MFDLMRTQTVLHYKRSEEGGYLSHNHEWVQASFQEPVELQCNVQPLRVGKSKVILPDGVRADSVQVLRSFTPLKVADHITEEEGDEVEYKGFRYEVFKEEDFSDYGLMTDHYKYLIKRKDQV